MKPLIIDAGPALNFLASGNHELLCDVMDRRQKSLLIPQTVRDEVHGRAQGARGERFKQCPARLEHLLTTGRLTVLVDDIENPRLVQKVEEVAGIPMARRISEPKDLGEVLVIAHALQIQEDGIPVTLLIDDRNGAEKARELGLRVVTTEGVLYFCATDDMVENRGQMKAIYENLAQFDDGLPGWDPDPKRNPLADRTLYLSHRLKNTSGNTK